MKALLRRLGFAGAPPAALHRKWLDTLCRPPQLAGRAGGDVGLDGGEGLEPMVRPRPGAGSRFLLGPPKH